MYVALSSEKNPLCQIFEIPKKLKCNGYLVKFFEFLNIAIINVDRNHMPSLSVKVSFSYSHFQKSRENPYYMYLRPLVKRPQRISTEKMFFFKNGMVGSSS